MNLTLISVIVPVYNVEKYLKKCLESIINQSYKNLEIILVNDGSTDSSLEICKSFTNDSRVVLIDKENEGLSSARQKGIESANGQFFCTIDSDDYLEKNYIEKMYKKIKSDAADICVCATRLIFKNGSTSTLGFKNSSLSAVKITKKEIYSNYIKLKSQYYMSDSWNKLYRTDFVRSSGVEFSLAKKYNGTDLLFNHKLLLHLPVISVVNEPLYNHQILENTRTSRKNKQLQKGFTIILDEIINEMNNLNYSDNINIQLSYLYVDFLRFAAIDLYNETRRFGEMQEAFKEFMMNNNEYLLKNKRIDLDYKQMHTKDLKIFCHLLKKGNSYNFIRYLKAKEIYNFVRYLKVKRIYEKIKTKRLQWATKLK